MLRLQPPKQEHRIRIRPTHPEQEQRIRIRPVHPGQEHRIRIQLAHPASGFCGWGQRRRKKFLEKVYCDRRYSDQQIALIQEADRAGIPLSGLKELCDPKISLGNMQVMLSYMKR